MIPDQADRLAFVNFGHLNRSDFGKDHRREVQKSRGSLQGRMSTGALARDGSTYLSILIASAKAKAGCTGAHGMRLAASFRRRSVPCRNDTVRRCSVMEVGNDAGRFFEYCR